MSSSASNSFIHCRRSLPILVLLCLLRVCPLTMLLQGPGSLTMLVQGPRLRSSSSLSPHPRSAGDARDATQSAATSPSVLCVSMTTSGTACCVVDHIANHVRYHDNAVSSDLRILGRKGSTYSVFLSGCRFLGRCCSPRRCH